MFLLINAFCFELDTPQRKLFQGCAFLHAGFTPNVFVYVRCVMNSLIVDEECCRPHQILQLNGLFLKIRDHVISQALNYTAVYHGLQI